MQIADNISDETGRFVYENRPVYFDDNDYYSVPFNESSEKFNNE